MPMGKKLLIVVILVVVGIAFLLKDQLLNKTTQSAPVISNTAGNPEAQPPLNGEAVSYSDAGFSPATLTVKVGTAVEFKNQSTKQMWVASDPHPTHTGYPSFDQRQGGNTYSFTFTEPGTYPYHNHLAPRDKGVVIVE